MRFGRHRADRAPEPRADAPPPEAADDGLLLDQLAGVLRGWGEFPIATADLEPDAVTDLFEGWARHVLVGAAPPDAPEGTPPGPRDWQALQRFVREHRCAERSEVERGMGDLRDVIWTFLQSLGRTIPEDRQSDRRMMEQLDRLRSVVHSTDTSALRSEALRSVTMIESLLEARSARMRRQVDALAKHLERVTVELIDVREQLGRDPLTGLHNRAVLDDLVGRMVHLGTVGGAPHTALLIDIDHFKWVNDRFGHGAGDVALKAVARCLGRDLRRRGDFVGRFGGDEFVALVPGRAHEVAPDICERLLFAIRDLEVSTGGDAPLRISVSIGAANLEPGDEVRDWLARADRALYAAKEHGRDRYVILPKRPEDAPR